MVCWLEENDKIRQGVRAYELRAGDVACFGECSRDRSSYYTWFYICHSQRDRANGTDWCLTIRTGGIIERHITIKAYQEFLVLAQSQAERVMSALSGQPVLTFE